MHPVQGTIALLHVGMRTYPDGGKHRAILSKGDGANGVPGMAEGRIDSLTALPNGLSRGSVVAVLELGATRLASLEERSTDEVQRACCAHGADMGRYLTEVVRSEWLLRPTKARGFPGLKTATVPRESIPEGWVLPNE